MRKSTREIAQSLAALAAKWLKPSFAPRRRAVERLVKGSGYSERMAGELIQEVFSSLSIRDLEALVKHELGSFEILDGFTDNKIMSRRIRAVAPKHILHILPSNVPQPGIVNAYLGILLGSRNTFKVSSKNPGIVDIFLDSLKAHDSALAQGQKISKSLTPADLVIAYGHDETLREIRRLISSETHFIGYGHRVSFAFFGKETLTKASLSRLAKSAARDVWMADQRGCLSPICYYVEGSTQISIAQFCRALAVELHKLNAFDSPKPNRSRQLRHKAALDRAELRRLKKPNIRTWKSVAPGQWSVILDESPEGSALAAEQLIYVSPVRDAGMFLKRMESYAGKLQAVALECEEPERLELASALAQLGASRVTRSGRLQSPPLTWHHDGRPALGDWVRWTDLET